MASQPTLAGARFSATVPNHTVLPQTLWRCTALANGEWSPCPGATSVVSVMFTDPAPPATPAFYSVVTDDLYTHTRAQESGRGGKKRFRRIWPIAFQRRRKKPPRGSQALIAALSRTAAAQPGMARMAA